MGTSQSREDRITESDTESDSDYYDEEEENEDQHDDVRKKQESSPSSSTEPSDSSSLDIEQKLKALKLKYPSSSSVTPKMKNAVKLYRHIGGNTPKAKWIVSDKMTSYKFVKTSTPDGEDIGDYDDCEESGEGGESFWFLGVGGGSKVKARVSTDMQLKMFGDQRRVDFVSNGVWALKFLTDEDYRKFVTRFQDYLFENVYKIKASDESRIKVYGKDFIGWANPEAADDSMWEDAEAPPDEEETQAKENRDLTEEFEEVANGGVQSLTLGALDNSFLVNDYGVQVYRNMERGIHGKGVCVRFDTGNSKFGSGSSQTTPNKALLMRAETNMMLMSPAKLGKPNSTGVKQLDIESGKIVSEWKFEKDGTEITMRDITNDTKGSQLDPSESTFLGLDDNRLCQWDMRDRRGIVQNIESPILEWTQGHQFSRGTNFQCFATTGDGSIVVGSLDGKIRLYSKTSMRMAKTAFPGLGSPITHVDVSYDGKWILGTTDTYLVLICTLFTDKDGRTKTGFSGRMGNKIPAPRLLKLTPLDSHLAGKDNKFHGGHFSWVTESGRQERHIVATVGKFSVIWDLERVKYSAHECYRNQQGLKSCYCYKILLKDESIVESRFMHDNFSFSGNKSPEAPLVVATPQKVSSISLSGKRL
ncbi:PREDICTED: protein CYPRO4 isoform X2 [Camelina sativa]|uniref:Protein CYPRO4 isoform X1 n=1 Tax=Camelina sativa TaxID=90675 RepID=A0ABM0XLV3_CAMSA|nr:PREDICTED: protein CYPRO4 isoform X1 [Camelina sativa]XP_010487855.1 PREDICTED: protein CYPRO4 isoform X2 [Camelina sativa]